MNILKKLVSLQLIIIMVYSITENIVQATNIDKQKPILVDVVLYDANDKYISLVKQSLENIQKQNDGNVIFNFFDSKNSQSVQDDILDKLISGNPNIFLINLVDENASKNVIDKLKTKNIPIIFFNREPTPIDTIKSYNKAYYVGVDAKETGILQGKIMSNLWNNSKKSIDKNNDNVLQYILFQGPRNDIDAKDRTHYVISTIEDNGIKIQELARSTNNWNRESAKIKMDGLFLGYSNKVEAIISNNDEMAIGAIEALQKYGYNSGDKNKTIPVLGIDATPDAQALIKKGYMAGSVLQDPDEMAKAIYTIGLNVYEGNVPLYNTSYKFDDTGIAVRLPSKEYLG